MSTTSRRDFLKKSLAIVSAVPVASTIQRAGLSGDAFAQDTAELVDETTAQAQALGYKHNAQEVDVTKFPKRAGEEGSTQFCSNCQLMQKTGMKIDGKEGEYGKCLIFPANLVNAKGWCNSWVVKAG